MTQYRFGAVVWIVNGAIGPLILMYVWLLVSQNHSLALTNSQIISYYLLSIVVVRLTQSWSMEDLGQKIKDGLISIHLIKPISYQIHQVSKDFSLKVIRLITLIPFILVFTWIFMDSLQAIDTSPDAIALFTIAALLGYWINYYLQNAVGLLAFWLQDTYGANHLFFTTSSLFSGQTVPFALMPLGLQLIFVYLPFRYILSFPIEILTGQLTPEAIAAGFLWGAFWLCIVILLSRAMYKLGIKNYTSLGI